MQIRKPVVPKKIKKCLSIFFGKMSLPQTVYFSISNFLYKLTQPIVYADAVCLLACDDVAVALQSLSISSIDKTL